MSKNRGDHRCSLAQNKMQSRELSASEVARYLKRLSSFYRDPKTGNPALSNALAELSLALGRRGNLTLAEAVANIGVSSKLPRSLEMNRLKDLNPKEVKDMLDEEAMTKADLIDLGAERFAIPRSGLMRMNMGQIAETIGAALRHEESLSIISREARRGSGERSS